MKVLSVIGTRPEAIKMAPVIDELGRHPDRIDRRVCVTAQHREMLDQVLDLFGIVPHHDLDLMRRNQSLYQVTASVLTEMEAILRDEQPDWVLVQGDTTTVAATALAAYYARIKVGHVEAGLRTFHKYEPFPEEINRRVAGIIADLHFAPTERSRANLLREGIDDSLIRVTGNPVVDALHMATAMPYDIADGPLAGVPWDKRIILVTAHRRENHGAPLERICAGLRRIAETFPDTHLVYPVHLNPNVWEPVHALLGDVEGITLTEPLDYLPLTHLIKRATLVITDSGGIQEEAPSLGKPVLVLRDVTERPEAVDAGTVRLVGANVDAIVSQATRLLTDDAAYAEMARAINPYGDGKAAQRIVQALLERDGAS